MFENRIDIGDLRITNNVISTTGSNEDLTLEAGGTGTVKINDVMEISPTPGIDDALVDSQLLLLELKYIVKHPQKVILVYTLQIVQNRMK